MLCEDYLSTPVFSTAVPDARCHIRLLLLLLDRCIGVGGKSNRVLHSSTSGTQECISAVGFHIGQMLLDQWTCQVHMDQVRQSQCQEQLRPHGTQQERYMCRHATTTRVVNSMNYLQTASAKPRKLERSLPLMCFQQDPTSTAHLNM